MLLKTVMHSYSVGSLLGSEFENRRLERFNDWGARGYDDFVPEEVIKTTSSGDETIQSPTCSASLPRIHRI